MPQAAVAGALAAAAEGVPVVLVGQPAPLEAELARQGGNLPIYPADAVIPMEEAASEVRRRKDASIMRAMQLHKEGGAAACVSMGHSGATMAAALFVLGRLKGIERPAILANIPTRRGYCALIDAGANADCRPQHLKQFALMGALYAQVAYDKARPSVGLMSIGEEPGKGNELVREAHALLAATAELNFYGNVEGRDLLKGTTDVVVTDGFTGNVMLKLAEGEAKEIFSMIREALRRSWRGRLGGLLIRPALKPLRDKLDPAEVGAQPLLGVDGYAFIGHGSSDARAVKNALLNAQRMVESGLLAQLKQRLASAAAA